METLTFLSGHVLAINHTHRSRSIHTKPDLFMRPILEWCVRAFAAGFTSFHLRSLEMEETFFQQTLLVFCAVVSALCVYQCVKHLKLELCPVRPPIHHPYFPPYSQMQR